MKVTFCTYDEVNGLGGTNTWLRRLLPVLQQQGIDPRVLFMTMGPGPYPTIEAVQRMGIECRQVERQRLTERRVRWTLEQLAQNTPDVFVPNVGTAAYFAAKWVREAGIPTIGVLHSDDPHYEGLTAEFVCGRPAFRLSSVACVSRFLEQQVLAQCKAKTYVRWLPCGAPLPIEAADPPVSTCRLIYAGRLVEEQKKISEVTRSLCKAVNAVPGTEAVIFGDGPARPAVENILLSQGHNLPVFLKGRVDSDCIQEKLLESHVFVLLSDYEGLPIALMEAMACGVVPICLRMRSGIPELVEDGVTGLLVSDRGDDFVNAVRRLKEEAGLWERLSKACRRKIEKDYTNDVCGLRWAVFLREMKEQSHSSRAMRIPHRFLLPPVNSKLADQDSRFPSLLQRAYWKIRAITKNGKREI